MVVDGFLVIHIGMIILIQNSSAYGIDYKLMSINYEHWFFEVADGDSSNNWLHGSFTGIQVSISSIGLDHGKSQRFLRVRSKEKCGRFYRVSSNLVPSDYFYFTSQQKKLCIFWSAVVKFSYYFVKLYYILLLIVDS